MRSSEGAYGIIKHQFKTGPAYLLQKNLKWNSVYNFISGHMAPVDNQDFMNTMIREIEEELSPIKYNKQFDVNYITKRTFEDIAFSERTHEETSYVFYIFQIIFRTPYNELSFLWQDNRSLNRWFTEKELLDGKGLNKEKITTFPVLQIIRFLPNGLKGLPDSFAEH